jgi:hypothetical protein
MGILYFFEEKWSAKAADSFLEKVYNIIDLIASIRRFPPTQLEKVRRAVITKHTSRIYKFDMHHIEILYFWDNRQEPLQHV